MLFVGGQDSRLACKVCKSFVNIDTSQNGFCNMFWSMTTLISSCYVSEDCHYNYKFMHSIFLLQVKNFTNTNTFSGNITINL